MLTADTQCVFQVHHLCSNVCVLSLGCGVCDEGLSGSRRGYFHVSEGF